MPFSHASIESADAREEKKRFIFVNVNIQEDTILLAAVYVSRLVRLFFLKGFTILSAAAMQTKASSRAHTHTHKKKKIR